MKYIIFALLISSSLFASSTTNSITTILKSQEYEELETSLRNPDYSGYRFNSIKFQSRSYRSNGRGDEELRQKFLITFNHNFYREIQKEYLVEIVSLDIRDERHVQSHIKIKKK